MRFPVSSRYLAPINVRTWNFPLLFSPYIYGFTNSQSGPFASIGRIPRLSRGGIDVVLPAERSLRDLRRDSSLSPADPYDWPSVQVDRCTLVRDSTTTVILFDLCSAIIVGTSRFGLSIEELVLQQRKEKGGRPFTASPFLVRSSARHVARVKRNRANIALIEKSASLGKISLNIKDERVLEKFLQIKVFEFHSEFLFFNAKSNILLSYIEQLFHRLLN